MSLFLSAVYVSAPVCTHGCLVLDAIISPGGHLCPEVLTLIKNPLWPSMPPRNSCEGGP